MAEDGDGSSSKLEDRNCTQMINVPFQGEWYVQVPSFFSKTSSGLQLRCRFCFAFPVKR